MTRRALPASALALVSIMAGCSATESGDASSPGGGGSTSGAGQPGSGGTSSNFGGSFQAGGSAGRGGQQAGGAPGNAGTSSMAGRGSGNSGSSNGGGSNGDGGGASSTCQTAPLSGGMQHCSSNASGPLSAGYTYTIWSSGSGGCITPYGVGAAFKATWNNSGDFLARAGLSLGSNKTFDQLGAITAEFSETKAGSAGNFSYIGIYGWSVNPLHEYYIIDDWYGSRPNPGEKVGTVTLDGGTYDILTHTQQNQPAITGGNATFVQFWSLRQTPRSCGKISVTEHFKAWAAQGLTLGKMYEAKVLVEAGGGNGSIDFHLATIKQQ